VSPELRGQSRPYRPRVHRTSPSHHPRSVGRGSANGRRHRRRRGSRANAFKGYQCQEMDRSRSWAVVSVEVTVTPVICDFATGVPRAAATWAAREGSAQCAWPLLPRPGRRSSEECRQRYRVTRHRCTDESQRRETGNLKRAGTLPAIDVTWSAIAAAPQAERQAIETYRTGT
jgi:hypothetical protein